MPFLIVSIIHECIITLKAEITSVVEVLFFDMDSTELQLLLSNLVDQRAENEVIEFKENNYDKEKIGQRISALANSANLLDKKYAYLVFGVHDTRYEIVGTQFQPSKLKIGNIELEHWLHQRLSPDINFVIYEFTKDGCNIVISDYL